jgi:hypothetical protein
MMVLARVSISSAMGLILLFLPPEEIPLPAAECGLDKLTVIWLGKLS